MSLNKKLTIEVASLKSVCCSLMRLSYLCDLYLHHQINWHYYNYFKMQRVLKLLIGTISFMLANFCQSFFAQDFNLVLTYIHLRILKYLSNIKYTYIYISNIKRNVSCFCLYGKNFL